MATPESEVREQLVPQQSPVDAAYSNRSALKGPSRPAPGKKVNSTVVTDAPFHPSPSLDPQNVVAVAGEHWEELKGYLAPAQEAFSQATEALKKIDNARIQVSKDETKNPHAILLIVAEATERQQDKVTRAFDTARKNMITAADALERDLSAPLEAKAMGVLSQEIRNHVKAIPKHEDRRTFVLQALKEGDLSILTSVLGAPAFLSGFSKEEHTLFTRTYREAAAPESVRRLSATRKAIELLEQRGGIFLTQVEQAMGGKWATVQKLRKARSEGERALLMDADKA